MSSCIDTAPPVCYALAGAYTAGPQGVPAQRRSLAANALASWNGRGGGSQAGISAAAASAVEQVSACILPTAPQAVLLFSIATTLGVDYSLLATVTRVACSSVKPELGSVELLLETCIAERSCCHCVACFLSLSYLCSCEGASSWHYCAARGALSIPESAQSSVCLKLWFPITPPRCTHTHPGHPQQSHHDESTTAR